MKLRDIAHTRSGDKGNISNIAVIVYRPEDYLILEQKMTAEKVKSFFGEMVEGAVIRYTLPQLGALNFVMYDALKGGVTRSLAMDSHGKTLSTILLDLEL
ncbi:MAG: hypothetical protein KDC80_13200 [Saprospiraceae bacterium]|nr:hypothetical protein [Saprospiraceae bacterium]